MSPGGGATSDTGQQDLRQMLSGESGTFSFLHARTLTQKSSSGFFPPAIAAGAAVLLVARDLHGSTFEWRGAPDPTGTFTAHPWTTCADDQPPADLISCFRPSELALFYLRMHLTAVSSAFSSTSLTVPPPNTTSAAFPSLIGSPSSLMSLRNIPFHRCPATPPAATTSRG